MAHTFRARLYTRQRLEDARTMQVLWRLLGDPLIEPTRFDAYEHPKLPFRPDAAEEAARLYKNQSALFVEGGRDDFLAVFDRQRRGLATWTFWLDARAMRGGRERDWLRWLYRLCGELPALYGFGCSVTEYHAKHRSVQVLDGGGTITGAVGMSIAEFWQYLPGVYWLTIFGAELVQAFGKEKLTSPPGVEATELGAGQLAIRLDEPVVPDDMGERLKKERQIADILGPTFFFDRNRTDLQFKPVSALLEALNRDDG